MCRKVNGERENRFILLEVGRVRIDLNRCDLMEIPDCSDGYTIYQFAKKSLNCTFKMGEMCGM